MAERYITIDTGTRGEVDIPITDIRRQNGLKKAIVELIRVMPCPDRECETTDFLMALQHVLDKHMEDDNKKIDRSRTKQAIKKLKNYE